MVLEKVEDLRKQLAALNDNLAELEIIKGLTKFKIVNSNSNIVKEYKERIQKIPVSWLGRKPEALSSLKKQYDNAEKEWKWEKQEIEGRIVNIIKSPQYEAENQGIDSNRILSYKEKGFELIKDGEKLLFKKIYGENEKIIPVSANLEEELSKIDLIEKYEKVGYEYDVPNEKLVYPTKYKRVLSHWRRKPQLDSKGGPLLEIISRDKKFSEAEIVDYKNKGYTCVSSEASEYYTGMYLQSSPASTSCRWDDPGKVTSTEKPVGEGWIPIYEEDKNSIIKLDDLSEIKISDLSDENLNKINLLLNDIFTNEDQRLADSFSKANANAAAKAIKYQKIRNQQEAEARQYSQYQYGGGRKTRRSKKTLLSKKNLTKSRR